MNFVRRRAILLGILAILAAAAALGAPSPSPGQAREVVVYSARSHYNQEPAFDAFTRKTGIVVKTFGGNSAELFERLKAEGERTPADVLITVDAGNLWNAARAGLLGRIDSPEIIANVPAHLRDPEGRWMGLTVRARTIVYHAGKVKPAEVSTYEAVGDPRWRGRLCLRTSSHSYNQSLLAIMIKRLGEARTEEVVRGWVANRPILINSDTKIIEAIAAGQCDVGIVNTYYLARILAKDPSLPVGLVWANQDAGGTHVNISGAGVTAQAKNRASAVKLLEYLTTPEAQQMFADSNYEFPANSQAAVNPIVARWGAFKPDTLNVAAAGELQAAAVRLADRAGYK